MILYDFSVSRKMVILRLAINHGEMVIYHWMGFGVAYFWVQTHIPKSSQEMMSLTLRSQIPAKPIWFLMFLLRSWGEPKEMHMMRSDKPNCGIQKKSNTKFNV